ncbi:MAG TPA: CBS domain-containing protein [Anaerolineae bacterium]|nr:CBS domain-containing protein [Anaerolineae bacterium]
MKTELVGNWMSEGIITVDTTTTLPEAHSLMKAKNIRRLPVVDKKKRIVGIISLGDIRAAEASPATSLSIWELNYLLAKLKVKDFMTENPVTVTPETTIGEAANLMLAHKISGLPVVNADYDLVGIITESDIFEMIVLHEWEALLPVVETI